MTPEAVYSALCLFDRWHQGRIDKLPEPATVEDDAERLDKEMAAAKAWQALADSEGGDVD